jgi:hypothetical protein
MFVHVGDHWEGVWQGFCRNGNLSLDCSKVRSSVKRDSMWALYEVIRYQSLRINPYKVVLTLKIHCVEQKK